MSSKRVDVLDSIVLDFPDLFQQIHKARITKTMMICPLSSPGIETPPPDCQHANMQETATHDATPAQKKVDELLFSQPCPRRSHLHRKLLHRLLRLDGAQAVERPFACCSALGIPIPHAFDRAGPLLDAVERWPWAQWFTRRLWTLGYQERAIAGIFDRLPAGFCAVVQAASDRLLPLIAGGAARRLACGGGEGGGGEEAGGAFLECLEDIWERDAEEGFVEFVFDPATERRVNVILNSRAAGMGGAHKEEALARLAAHDAPISCLPLDFLQASVPTRSPDGSHPHVRDVPTPPSLRQLGK
jgi:hypothetical protein